MEYKSCAITGHRPTRFKWKYREDNTGCKRLKKRLHDQFIFLYEQGVRTFLVGAALGVDLWSGEILLELKKQPEYNDIHLVVAIPFAGHDDQWDDRSKGRLERLKKDAEVITVSKQAGAAGYKRRNYYMVDHSDHLLAVYDNTRSLRSGTGQTVHYAQKKGLLITLIHPDSGKVSYLQEECHIESMNEI